MLRTENAENTVKPDESPAARALLALELVQDSPGIAAERLADMLGVSERAARRYVAILREAGIPIEAVRRTTAPAPDRAAARPDPGPTTTLVQACSNHRRVRLGYRSEAGSEWVMEVDP